VVDHAAIAVTSLRERQLITRNPRPGDRRQVVLGLNERGSALHAAMMPQVMAINRQLLSALPADAVALLDESLSRLQQYAEQTGLADARPRTGRQLGRGRRPRP
jgi:DNA-binding MarR family transcriptional regulator